MANADLAAALHSCGRSGEALPPALRAVSWLESTTDGGARLRALKNLSIIAGASGSHALAISAAEAAVGLAERQGEPSARFAANAALNDALLRAGRVEDAARNWKSLLLAGNRLSETQRAQGIGSLGQCLSQLGDYDGAESAFESAAREFATQGLPERLLAIRISLANTLRYAGRLREAIAVAARCEIESRASPGLRPYALFELGASLGATRALDAAATLLAYVATEAHASGSPDLEIAALTHEAIARYRLTQFDDARRRSSSALDAVLQTMADLSDDMSTSGRAQREDLSAVHVAACRSAGTFALALGIERCRAVGLLTSIGGARASRASDRTAELQELAERAKRAADELGQEVTRHAEAGDLKGDALWALKRRAADALAAADAARERVQREKGLHAAVAPTSFAGPAEVRALLRPGQVFVSICTLDDTAFALVCDRAHDEPRYVDLGETRVFVAACKELREAALNDEPGAEAKARLVGDSLLRRLALPPSTTSVVLSVDAELADVPFGAIAASHPTPLAVAMMPSATVWQALRAYPIVKDRPPVVAGISDYGFEYAETTRRVYLSGGRLASLPTAVTEANAAAGANGVLLTNERATEPAVRTAMQDEAGWDVIHVVCHGIVHPKVPALSGLALRPAGTDDGFFDVREVLDLRVRTNLVVLAACQTGLGKVYAGEGIWGLGRAFMLAGAPRVLVSLWKVDDAATTALMSAFHDGRRAGLASADALRRAQDHVRETREWAHPRYWAAWQLWGLPD